MPFLRKGPVYVDGEHVFTLARDVKEGQPILPEDFEAPFPNGHVPQRGKIIPPEVHQILCGDKLYTQDAPDAD